jgi:hypothetical protein
MRYNYVNKVLTHSHTAPGGNSRNFMPNAYPISMSLVVSVLAIGPKVRGFKLGLQQGKGSKAVGPML